MRSAVDLASPCAIVNRLGTHELSVGNHVTRELPEVLVVDKRIRLFDYGLNRLLDLLARLLTFFHCALKRRDRTVHAATIDSKLL